MTNLYRPPSKSSRCIRYGVLVAIVVVAMVARIGISQRPQTAIGTPVLKYQTSWLGNSFSTPDARVQHSVEAIAVAQDGRLFTNSIWDEDGREAGIYRDGKALGHAGHTHGWGCGGGRGLAISRKYLFLAMRMDSENGALADSDTWPPKGTWWFGVSRRPIDHPSSPAPFPTGKGGRADTLPQSFAVINEVPEGTNAEITGLAANSNLLFVSNPHKNAIQIYDSEAMTLVNSLRVERPGKVTVDADGSLWVIQAAGTNTPARILHLSLSGDLLPEVIGNLDDPRDLAFDSKGRLLVAESGPRQQILVYDLSAGPGEAASYGVNGGMYSEVRGKVGDWRLDFPRGVTADASGNLYVGGGLSGADIRKFSPAGRMEWRMLGLQFVDCATADPLSDGQSIYTKAHRFSLDFTRPAGREWSWKATTLDPFRYPNDPRLSPSFPKNSLTAYAVRYLNGRRFLCLVADSNAFLIYRFQGEIAVPSVIFGSKVYGWLTGLHPEGRFIWRDTNGNGDFEADEFFDADGVTEFDAWGWDIDDNGDIWQAREEGGIWTFPLGGFDSVGNPVYTRTTARRAGLPAPFAAVERVRYLAATGTMFVSGYTVERPRAGNGYWGQAGTEIVRYDNWNAGNRISRYRIPLPYDPPEGSVKAIAVAGQRIFAGLMNSAGTAQKTLARNLYVYDAHTGGLLGRMTPGPEIGSAMGWIDIGQGVNAFQRKDGEYLVFMEEVAFSKTIFYRIRW
jgi:hypothetical protein